MFTTWKSNHGEVLQTVLKNVLMFARLLMLVECQIFPCTPCFICLLSTGLFWIKHVGSEWNHDNVVTSSWFKTTTWLHGQLCYPSFRGRSNQYQELLEAQWFKVKCLFVLTPSYLKADSKIYMCYFQRLYNFQPFKNLLRCP